MLENLEKYVDKALSEENRKPFDGDSNAPYRLVISMSEVGPMYDDDHDGGFWFEAKVPPQVDNCLGGSVSETLCEREEAVAWLYELINKLRRE